MGDLTNQTFVLNTTQGLVGYQLKELDYLRTHYVQDGIIFGVKIGACSLMFIVCFLFTKNWRQPVFILNQVSLFFLWMETVFYITFELGDFYSTSTILTLSANGVGGFDKGISNASSVFQLFLIWSIEGSLFFQCWTMYRDAFSFVGQCVPWVMLGIAVIPNVVFWFIYVVVNCVGLTDPYNSLVLDHPWIYTVPRILFTFSVVIFSLFSVVKLFITLRRRRNMGLRQFGPFQIIFIMSIQCMIVPAIITMVDVFLPSSPQTLTTLTSMFVTILLPLSSVWAKFKSTEQSSPINMKLASTGSPYKPSTFNSTLHTEPKTPTNSQKSRKDSESTFHDMIMSMDHHLNKDVEKYPFK
ncbi:hypothetical protein TRICI_001357 [Trichomonascus ciferrii]|uniref:Uncharacterized protein n=1 Tax=Trichomonascus ciferrii TaxID=44093 RepID=A0A642VCN1_9ASCO|nr:hypothetical protein TRICI_001357 [Trichomonascus ciferrii]